MKLEYPMNGALPNTDHTRDRLLAKIFRFRKENRGASESLDEDFASLYAFGELVIFVIMKKGSILFIYTT